MTLWRRSVGWAVCAVLLSGCQADAEPRATSASASTSGTVAAPRSSLVPWQEVPVPTPTLPRLGPDDVDVGDPVLRDELLLMQVEDQMERTGAGLPPGTPLPPIRDAARAERLKVIIVEHGWPTIDLVGPMAATAAWLVAQHADHDIDFQQEAVRLLTAAAVAGQASAGDVAYLTDRVAVNLSRPQTYGTQIRCRDGLPAPATPLLDPGAVEVLRADAGLDTLESYLESLRMTCANEAAEGLDTG